MPNKHYLRKTNTEHDINAAGTRALTTLGLDIVDEMEALVEEQETIGIHKGKLVVRITSKAYEYKTFAARLLFYLTDGSVTDYLPGAVEDLQQLENLVDGFTTTGNTSVKIVGEAKLSAPIKATDGSVENTSIHEVTYVVDVKKQLKEAALMIHDPLTQSAYQFDFAVEVAAAPSQTYRTSSMLIMEYSIHSLPMKVFRKKNI